MRNQVADESARRLELLPRPGRARAEQVVAQQVAVGHSRSMTASPKPLSRRPKAASVAFGRSTVFGIVITSFWGR